MKPERNRFIGGYLYLSICRTSSLKPLLNKRRLSYSYLSSIFLKRYSTLIKCRVYSACILLTTELAAAI